MSKAINSNESENIMSTKSNKSTSKVVAGTASTAVAAGKPETISTGAVAVKPEVITAAPSKASIANAIFKESYAQPTVPARKDIIARAVKESGLTAKGAATYLQNYREKHGMVAKKVVAGTAPTA